MNKNIKSYYSLFRNVNKFVEYKQFRENNEVHRKINIIVTENTKPDI